MSAVATKPIAPTVRLKLAIQGAVQGVGFRPFVYRLAQEFGLAGWVSNSPQGVFLEAEGAREAVERFRRSLLDQKPPRSLIQNCDDTWLEPAGYEGFVIRESEARGERTTLIQPDLATCPDCLRDILDRRNRRYLYPFTNCTHCGPRFSIIQDLPYDRANTSMRRFKMCAACQAEYDDPADRRFHAQPNACPVCGPRLELWAGGKFVAGHAPRKLARNGDALCAAAGAILHGQIVAVKGIGGFHLMVDARNEQAVSRLRERKHREEKPLALLFPSLECVRDVCEVSTLESVLLTSPEAPIVLLRRLRNPSFALAPGIAPGNPNLGFMLPSNPLHHLLMAELAFPVVATSGNRSDEPICTDELDARERLQEIADLFLVHNRPIVRHVDDSIVRVIQGRAMILRRARGYAPLPITIPVAAEVRGVKLNAENQPEPPHVGCYEVGETILAVGAHLKNSVALAVGERVYFSQHLGDLDTERAHQAFRASAADLPRLYRSTPGMIAADLHPDYLSTRHAQELGKARGRRRVFGIQHHLAHVLSCIAENSIELPALGVAWDGTGYGADGGIWGGEFFRVTDESAKHVARWRPFRLPGGGAAAREPRRATLGLLYEMFGAAAFARTDLMPLEAFSANERAVLKTVLARGVNAPWCCSVGRLFDVVVSLTGLRHKMRYEGQAAMELEFALDGIKTNEGYSISVVTPRCGLILDWEPMMEAIIADVQNGVPRGIISARFHNTLAETIVCVAQRLASPRVALSGGCFQNRYLTERTITRLRAEGFEPYWHQHVPTNDGGIALGQILGVRRALEQEAR
jgi:hydrogenase maturation protein HypF